jgi:putative addiction module killer protein
MAGRAADVHTADAAAKGLIGKMRASEPLRIIRSEEFSRWFHRLKDPRGRVAIGRRLDRLGTGNTGDIRNVGGGVAEFRLDVGPGYRIYFAKVGNAIVVLLCGGDKSTQAKDIETAKQLARRATEIIDASET